MMPRVKEKGDGCDVDGVGWRCLWSGVQPTHILHNLFILFHSAQRFREELSKGVGAEEGGTRRAIDLGTGRQRMVHTNLHHAPFRNLDQLLHRKLEGRKDEVRLGRGGRPLETLHPKNRTPSSQHHACAHVHVILKTRHPTIYTAIVCVFRL